MKKNLVRILYPREKFKKISLMTKLCLLLVVFSLQLQANVYSQQNRISIKLDKVSAKKLFVEIEKISDFAFVYNYRDIKSYNDISVNFKNTEIEKILNHCFENTNICYTVIDNHVIIKIKDKKDEKDKNDNFIKGKVVDKKGNPLPGATIKIKGTIIGTSTDMNGNFKINIPSGTKKILIVSFVGMKEQEIDCSKKKEIKIVLEEDREVVNEVVCTGIFKKNKETYTGAVSVITDDELKMFGNRNLISTLKNIDPSFNVLQNNDFGSDPNHLPEINIRGNSSLPNVDNLKEETKSELNTPLIMMDGFEISLQQMMDIDESEVKNITILKDASASAIYGSRGANGVVVITLKDPEQGRLQISYKADVNIEIPDLSDYNLLNAREKLLLEERAGMYLSDNIGTQLKLNESYSKKVEAINRGVDTDWLAQPLRTSVGHNHNLRMEGGDKQFRYSVSMRYKNTEGVMKESNRNSFNGFITLTYYKKNITFRNRAGVALTKSNMGKYGSFADYAKMNPYFPLINEHGEYIKNYNSGFDNSVTEGNPLYNTRLNMINSKTYTTLSNNFSLEWKINSNLNFKANIGVSQNRSHRDYFLPADDTRFQAYDGDDVVRKGSYDYQNEEALNYTGSFTLNYNKTFFEKHSVYLGINGEITEKNSEKFSIRVEGFPHEQLDFLGVAMKYGESKPSGDQQLTRHIGLTSNFNYSYDNKYFLDLSYRMDGSSQFGTDKRFAPFYSGGIGWNIHKEKFLENATFINRLKVRGSYGIAGSQNFDAFQAMSTYKYYLDDRYRDWMGAYLLGLGNDNLKWQTTYSTNIGFETSLFNYRLKATFDIYSKTTSNLLSSLEIPLSNGFPSYTENIGEIDNEGFELSLSCYPIRNTAKRLIWSITGNLCYNKNKIVEISEALKEANKELQEEGGANPNFLYKEGYSLNTIYVVKSLGIDPYTGRELYQKVDGTATYQWDAMDRVACGIDVPKYRGNLSSMLNYKKFVFNVSMGYQFGGQQYNSTLINKVENVDYTHNVDSRVYNDRWKKPGDVSKFKAITDQSTTNMTSRFVQDETLLTLQNVNLSYRMQNSWLSNTMKIKQLLIRFNAEDLLYISTIKQERGLQYPFSRRLTFSLSAKF